MKAISQSFSGAYMDFRHPEKTIFSINDIAHHLSIVNRFTGATTVPYPVGQHSVHVSKLVDPKYAMYGLMHDGSEAYMNDLSSPLKLLLPDYRALERKVQNAIWDWLGLSRDVPPCVKIADNEALVTERRDLLPNNLDPAGLWDTVKHYIPDTYPINPLSAEDAEQLFLDRFIELSLS